MTAARIKTHQELERFLEERRARLASANAGTTSAPTAPTPPQTPLAKSALGAGGAFDAASPQQQASEMAQNNAAAPGSPGRDELGAGDLAALEDFAPRIVAPSQDTVWRAIQDAAHALAAREPVLASLLHAVVLGHDRLEDALSYRIAQKLGGPELTALTLRDLAADAMLRDPDIGAAARADIVAVFERDPACKSYLEPVLFFKGFQALQASRVANWYWRAGRRELASALQMRISEIFGVDIHPGARIGRGLMIDHATGVVVGETAVIGDDVSMLHGVTLGGTGKESGDRHPKIGDSVLIGAGASILGNITVGECSRVGAGAVVLSDVPRCTTVAGVPAKIVGDSGCDRPSLSMNHVIS